MLSADRIFHNDYEDGTFDVLATGPLSLPLVAAVKSLAHWFSTGVPLALLAPVLGLLFNLPIDVMPLLVLAMLAGTPAVSFVAAIGASLTLGLRRSGVLLALLVLPLYVPVLIFGVSTGLRSHRRSWLALATLPHAVRLEPGQPGARAACRGRRPCARRFDRPYLRSAAKISRLSPMTNVVTSLANPTRFLSFTATVLPWLAALVVLLFGIGLYLAFFVAPPDYQQGETVRIMFIHVPSAWLAMGIYVVIAIAALGTLIWRHPLADVAAKAAVPIGATFTFLALVTGSLWGKPMWGTYWVWDARLTSMLVLFLLYLGLIALWQAIEEPGRAGRAAAILALVGVVNIPIIKFSVDWWNTLHQPASVFRIDGPTIDPSLLTPLFVMGAAFAALFVLLHLIAMRAEILRRRVRALQQTQVAHAAVAEA